MKDVRSIVLSAGPSSTGKPRRSTAVVCRLVACLALCLVTGCSNNSGPKPSRVEQATTTLHATVEAIDLDTRIVTLRGPVGGSVTVKAGESVKNLSRLKVGDQVRAVYHESLAVRVRKAGDPVSGYTVAASASSAAGSTGGGGDKAVPVAAWSQTISATVQNVDRKGSAVTLKGPGGRMHTLKVRDPKRLNNVKVGDEVDITYSESLAVSLDRVGEGGVEVRPMGQVE
jgi:Cu/Ag efflux protein CusF